MTPLLAATLIFCCVFGGALAGLALHARLPEHHLDARSKDVVTLVMGLIATVSALVLGLLIASAHDAFDKQQSEVQQLSAHVIQLDRFLAHYGPEAKESRDLLRRLVAEDITLIWPAERAKPESGARAGGSAGADELYDKVLDLAPKTASQRFGQARALEMMTTMANTHQLLREQAGDSMSWPFFVVLVFWLVALFVGFGLFARPNATVVTALCVGALTVAGAIFLILEMSRPYSGLIAISSAPMHNALDRIGR
jgi:hypothetical protein